MKIDFNKLIELLLPTFLRRPRLFALLRSLISKPLQNIFSRFYIWRAKSRYEASVTPQVCSLIHAVERTFDCVCEITELDGKPYDFLVSIDRSTDLNAIREFIDKHKLAGKSYIFKLGDVSFAAEWFNYVDEDIVELYFAEWTAHVDENDGDVLLTVTVLADVDTGWKASVIASAPVKTRLNVFVSANYRKDGMLHHGGSATVTLLQGSTTGESLLQLTEGAQMPFEIFASVYPSNDDFYNYIVNTQNGTNR